MGAGPVHVSQPRVPQLHPDLGAPRELPVAAHQGAGALDMETEELLRPHQLRAGGERPASQGQLAAGPGLAIGRTVLLRARM